MGRQGECKYKRQKCIVLLDISHPMEIKMNRAGEDQHLSFAFKWQTPFSVYLSTFFIFTSRFRSLYPFVIPYTFLKTPFQLRKFHDRQLLLNDRSGFESANQFIGPYRIVSPYPYWSPVDMIP